MAQETDEMDKRTAEEILGFDSSSDYTIADLTEKYHQAVTDKTNAGADSDTMGRIDHAKSYLDSYFVEDPTTTLTSEKDLGSKTSYVTSTYTGPGLSEMAFVATINSFEKTIGDYDPVSLPLLYDKAALHAREKLNVAPGTAFDVPELSGDYPLWYQAMNTFIRRFPWRIVFALIVLWIGLPWVGGGDSGGSMFEILSYGIGAIGKFIVIAAIIAVNSITGIGTNLVRYGLTWLSEHLLQFQLNSVAVASLERQLELQSTNASNIRSDG